MIARRKRKTAGCLSVTGVDSGSTAIHSAFIVATGAVTATIYRYSFYFMWKVQGWPEESKIKKCLTHGVTDFRSQ